jgi:hypothetical protein
VRREKAVKSGSLVKLCGLLTLSLIPCLLFMGGYKYLLFCLMGREPVSDMTLTKYGISGAYMVFMGRVGSLWLTKNGRYVDP